MSNAIKDFNINDNRNDNVSTDNFRNIYTSNYNAKIILLLQMQ